MKTILAPVPAVRLVLATLLLCASGYAASNAPAIASFGQKAELTASDGQHGSFVGTAVAISGNTVVVGAPGLIDFGDHVLGVVYVYVKPVNGWGNMTQVARLTPSESAASNGFGTFVAISGNTIAVASNTETYVFVEPAGGWVDMTETAILTNANSSCPCGLAAIDGNTIVVGLPAPTGSWSSNTVEVFIKPATGWQTTSRPNAELIEPHGASAGQTLGRVAIEGNNVVTIGNLCSQIKCEDYIFLFSKPAVGWRGRITPTATLSTSDASDVLDIGNISLSGNTLVASGTGTSDGKIPGHAYVWVEPAGGWRNMTETAQLTDSNTFYDQFGTSTAIVGSTILVGTPSAIDIQTGDYRGAVYVYVKPAAGWQTTSTPNAQLLSSDWTQNDGFGTSVAGSNGTVIVGEPDGPVSNYVGAAYVFSTF